MQYVFLKKTHNSNDIFLNLDIESDELELLRMYFDEETFYLEFYDTENSNLQEAIGNSIKDLVFLILYKRSPYLGHAFEHLSSRALDAILTNNYTEYEKIKEDRRILYFNEILPKYKST